MKTHKFYYTDSNGNFDGYKIEKLTINHTNKYLNISGDLTIPLKEILKVELRPFEKKGVFLAIDVFGPSVNNQLTTLPFIHKNFLTMTKVSVMQEFIDEISPLIEGNEEKIIKQEEKRQELLGEENSTEDKKDNQGVGQIQYCLNISFFIGFYHKEWFSFDDNKKAINKTISLMLLAGIINIIGILLIVVPYYNYKMMNNLKIAGWSKGKAFTVYFLTTYPCYIFWAYKFLT